MEGKTVRRLPLKLFLGMCIGVIFSPFSFFLVRILLLHNLPSVFSPLMPIMLSVVFVVFLFTLPAILIFGFLALKNLIMRQWDQLSISLSALLVCGVSFLVVPYLGPASHAALQEACRRATENGKVIVVALEHYHQENGKYPEDLCEVVPKYMEKIPPTGMVGYPEFRYRLPNPNDKFDKFSGYEIRVSLTYLLDFDALYYWPEGNNRDVFGKAGKVVDDWVFFDD